MADIYIMNHEDVYTETSKGVNMLESSITPRSDDSSNHHFEDQMLSKNHNNVVDKIKKEIVETSEDHHHAEDNDKVEDFVTINIKDTLQDKIEAILQDKNESLLSTKCCIYRVSRGIRKHKPEAYTPQVVSIGPLHYSQRNLRNMETHKLVFFKAFIKQSGASLDKLIAIVKDSELNIRECYSENIKHSMSDLVKMILVDAGFIIELFMKIYDHKRRLSDDSTLSTPLFAKNIILDLIMLENQLPFFILEELFNLAFPPEKLNAFSSHTHVRVRSFLELTFMFFDDYNVQRLEPSTTRSSPKHFTDLLRTFHLKQEESERILGRMGRNALLYGANQLHKAGVKFKVHPTNKCLLDLNFSRGVLKIPQIMVREETEYEFRNIIALEQCHYPSQSYICDYALFLDCLINTSIDVDILAHRQIIRKFLADSDDVAQVFNGLGKGMLHVNSDADYLKMCRELNAFCRDPGNNLMATLRNDYCRTPWQTAASVAAILLLILTIVQTICSIIQVSPEVSKFV